MAQSDDKFFQPRWWSWISGAKQGEESRGCSPAPTPSSSAVIASPGFVIADHPWHQQGQRRSHTEKVLRQKMRAVGVFFHYYLWTRPVRRMVSSPTWQGWTRGNGSSCTRAGLDWRLWRIYSLKGLSSIGRGCPRKLWSHHSWSI